MKLVVETSCPYCEKKFMLTASKAPFMHVFIEFHLFKADWINHVYDHVKKGEDNGHYKAVSGSGAGKVG